MKRVVIVVAAVWIVCVAALGGVAWWAVNARRGRAVSRVQLPKREQRPEFFERYLTKHPEAEAHRDAAMWHYCAEEPDDSKLKHHTFEMIRYHPDNSDIHYYNVSLFYRDAQYRDRVAEALEGQLADHPSNHTILWILAMTYEHGAVAMEFANDEDRESWLSYRKLPLDHDLPTETDTERADKAAEYYRAAIAAASDDGFHPAFYAEQLADLLAERELYEEALEACETAIPGADDISKPRLYLTYARCLYHVDRAPEALAAAQAAADSDRGGSGGGPACTAAKAHILRGHILLEQGDVDAATEELLAAASVERCCHTKAYGISLALARELMEAGEYKAVEEFCTQVLAKFGGNADATKHLQYQARNRLAAAEGRPD